MFYYISKLIHDSDRQRIKPLLISNAVILILIALTILAWKTGFVETRNNLLNEPPSAVSTEDVESDTELDIPTEDNSTEISEPEVEGN